jgi:hypothetical protein
VKRLAQSRHTNLLIMFISSCFVWLAISPLGSVPDEPAHVIYASAVVDGQLGIQENWGEVFVPADVASVSSKTCIAFKPDVPASCQKDLTSDESATQTVLGTTGYPPLYYAAVGLPLLFGFNENSWYAMRFISIVLASLLIGLALFAARNTLEMNSSTAVLLALTPMVSYMVASVNPNGLEIVAGITFTFSLVHFWVASRKDLNIDATKLLISAAISAAVLSNVRPYSWLLTIALILVLLIGCNGLLTLMKTSINKKISITIPLTLLTGFAWTLYVRASQASFGATVTLEDQSSFTQVIRDTVPRLDNYWTSTVGLFGWIDHTGFQLLEQAWISTILLIAISISLVGLWREKLSTALFIVGSVIVAPIGIYLLLFTDGVGYQARYAMALTCSIPILLQSFIANKNYFDSKSIVNTAIPALVLFTFLGSWLNSSFRYAFGMPLHFPDLIELIDIKIWFPPILQFLALSSLFVFIYIGIANFSNKADSTQKRA